MNLAIVQARMTSSRLPGKVLLPVMGRPLLGYQLERIERARSIDRVCVATTANETDDAIVQMARELGTETFRGPEDDVLARFHGCATEQQADVVVRLTADCPLVDPVLIDAVVALRSERPQADYASNALHRTFPVGLDCEAFTVEALDAAMEEATNPREREHVTPFIYGHEERFRVRELRNAEDLSAHRWTVDTPEDLRLVTLLLENLYPRDPAFSWTDALKLVQANPEWSSINASVRHRAWTVDPRSN